MAHNHPIAILFQKSPTPGKMFLLQIHVHEKQLLVDFRKVSIFAILFDIRMRVVRISVSLSSERLERWVSG